MLPLRVSLQGFLSYKEEQIIDFTGSSLWMLWGPNGVGKSAIFDAILFALYNTHRAVVGKNNNLHELMNHHSDRLIVVFDFAMNGELYRVRRTGVRSKGQAVRITREAFLLQGNDLTDLEHLPAKPISETDSETGFHNWVHNTIGLNYEAFTSSVLLLQGKSERLLEADPEKRYKTLAELIDLSAYQKLHLAADDRRKHAKGSMETLTKQIQGISPIADETIDLLKSQAEAQRAVLIAARQEVERLTALFPQSEQWERVTSQMSVQQEKLQQTQDLLERSREITDKFARFELLNQVLPGLTQLLLQRERFEQKEGEITDVENKLSVRNQALCKAQTTKTEIEIELEGLASVLVALNLQKSQAQERLRLLAPLVKDLAYIEQHRVELAEIEDDFAQFPPNLTQQVPAKELQLKELDEKAQDLPWLRAFAQARGEFATALKQKERLCVRLEELDTMRQQYQELHDQKKKTLADVDREERSLHEQKLLARRNYDEVMQHLKDFSQAALQPVCSLCGQSIGPEHVATEKKHLQDEIESAKIALAQIETSHQELLTKRVPFMDECMALEKQITDIVDEHNKQNFLKQKLDANMEQNVKQIRKGFANISTPFQQAICSFVPIHDEDWLATYYPSLSDLETLQHAVDSRGDQKSQLEALHQQERQLQELIQRRSIVERQLGRICASINIDEAERARFEQQEVDKNLDSLTLDIEQKQKKLQNIKSDCKEAEIICTNLNEKMQEEKMLLEKAKSTRDTLKDIILQVIHALPLEWQEHAKFLNTDELERLERERKELAPYSDLLQQLSLANHRKETCVQQIQELQMALTRLPQEAKRAPSDVQLDLAESRSRYEQIEGECDDIQLKLGQLIQQQEHYHNLECQRRDAQRQHYLYSHLTELLGRSGLQLYLLRRAEQIIIELANRTLSGLSHNRLRLELRGESNNAAQSEKALDLVVYDYDTGQRAMLVNQVSGSQRFRIAVSLALAIGRYTNGETRRIKSVIIDEGFGSLDKTGRDDMIQELNTLGQELERIILVSHQDEFASAFPNRYSFELIDKASHVKLLSDD